MAPILRSQSFCAIEDINFQDIASRFGHAIQGLAPRTPSGYALKLLLLVDKHGLAAVA